MSQQEGTQSGHSACHMYGQRERGISRTALRSLRMRSFASLTRPVNCEIMISMGDVDRSEGSSITTIPPLSSTCAQGTQLHQTLLTRT